MEPLHRLYHLLYTYVDILLALSALCFVTKHQYFFKKSKIAHKIQESFYFFLSLHHQGNLRLHSRKTTSGRGRPPASPHPATAEARGRRGS